MISFLHFTKKVLDYWCEFKISTGIDSKTNPKNEIVWNNRKILVGKKPVFYQTWCDAGITKISDIINQNQKFLKCHEFVMKFNLNVPFITYYDLVNAIPKDWKANLANPIPNVTQDTTVNSLRTSSIYSINSFRHCLRSSHCRNQNYTPRIYRKYHQERLSYAI